MAEYRRIVHELGRYDQPTKALVLRAGRAINELMAAVTPTRVPDEPTLEPVVIRRRRAPSED